MNTPIMNTHQALYLILSRMEYGKMRALCADDLKFHIHEMTGHYPGKTEFQNAINAMKTYPELDLISCGLGYFRTISKPEMITKTKSLSIQIRNRQSELLIIQQRING